MLQIKTIVSVEPGQFDDKVNAALREGWQLTKRGTIYEDAALLAELERQAVPENERNCGNCLYCAQDGGDPCDTCDVDTLDAWEPGEGVVAV
jgi:Zn finger protein HypA/HybF involved in hydrogenase expression